MYKWPTKTFTGGRKYKAYSIPWSGLSFIFACNHYGWLGFSLHLQRTDDSYTTDKHKANQQVVSLSLSKSSKSSNSPPKLSDYYIIHPLLNWVRTLPQFVWNQFQHLTEFCQFNKGSSSSVYLQQRSRAISYITGKILWNKSAKSDSKIAATHWTKSQSSAINQRAKWMI